MEPFGHEVDVHTGKSRENGDICAGLCASWADRGMDPWEKKTADRKISPWILFTVSLVLILQVLYFEDSLTFQSDVYYWYNEEPFMTGE